MKKVLVTGATGFVGNYVVEELLRRGYNVTASSAKQAKAETFSWFSRVSYVEFDLRNYDEQIDYCVFFKYPDILIHLAWEGLPNYKESFHLTENLPRHFSFIQNMLQNGLSDITVTGTCLEYGMQEGCLDETLDCFPEIAYAKAKDELRKMLTKSAIEKNIHLKWLRLFYVYGKGQSPNSLLSQLEKAIANGDAVFNMSGGEQVRDFIAIEQAAHHIVSIALQNNINGIINCCSGKPVTVKDFVTDFINQRAVNIKLNFGFYRYADYEPMQFWGDTAKLHLGLTFYKPVNPHNA